MVSFEGRKLADCVCEWRKIGAPDTLCQWITEGVQLPFVNEPLGFALKNHTFDREQTRFVIEKIKELEKCGAIKQVDTKPRCISPIGCVPKKLNDLRLIHDLRLLNHYIDPPKFVNEGIDTVIELV